MLPIVAGPPRVAGASAAVKPGPRRQAQIIGCYAPRLRIDSSAVEKGNSNMNSPILNCVNRRAREDHSRGHFGGQIAVDEGWSGPAAACVGWRPPWSGGIWPGQENMSVVDGKEKVCGSIP